MARTLEYTEKLTIIDCPQCHMQFAIPGDFEDRRRKDHNWFYCPQGHSQHFPQKTDLERAREEAAALRQKLETEKRNVEFWRERKKEQEKATELARHQRDAYKGHATRLKKRVSKGKCPCCSSTFVNLAAHMKKQHPDYVQEEEQDG